jgi:hypothetical protein
LETRDSLGNEFSVDNHFNPTVNLVNSEISVYQSHPIKLFLYNNDSPSSPVHQLLSEAQMNLYLTYKQWQAAQSGSKSGHQISIASEPMIGKENHTSITVVETHHALKLVTYRKFTKIPHIPKDSLELLMDQLDQFAENKKELSATLRKPLKDNVGIISSKQQQKHIDDAVNKMSNEKTVITSTAQPLSTQAPLKSATETPQVVRTKVKKETPREQPKKLQNQHKDTTIKYFECEEGLAFLQQQIKL